MQANRIDRHRRTWLRTAVSAMSIGTVALVSVTASAQDWPTRPVKLVIALGPGSAGDLLARSLAPHLQALWKQPVIVENKPGAGGVVGAEYVVNATDGHTLLLGTLSTLLPKFTVKDLRFDPETDLIPVYRVINYQLFIATNAKTAQKAKTLADVVALSKSSPNGVFFGGTGPTSIFNLSMALVNKSLGIRYTSVDFNNVGAMNLALLRDDVQLMVNTPSSVKGQIDAGEIRPLAAISTERFPNLPDVPTVYEAVQYKGFLPLSWAGFLVPKNTPRAVVDRIAKDVETVVTHPEVKKQVESQITGSLLRSSPAQFSKEFREEAAAWKDLFTSMNIKPE